MNPKRGAILLYTLCIFMMVLSWFDVYIIAKVRNSQRERLVEKINHRIDIEEAIITHYKEKIANDAASLEHDIEDGDFEEGEPDPIYSYNFYMHGVDVTTTLEDEIINVNFSGNINISFKYVIIVDGSFKQLLLEEET